MLLPAGSGEFQIGGEQVDRTIAGTAYHRTARITGNVFEGEASWRTIAPEFPASEAPAAQEDLRDLDRSVIFIYKPKYYTLTGQEAARVLNETPATAEEYVKRGNMLRSREDYGHAIADFNKAVAMKPGWATALIARGLTEVLDG